MKLRLIAASVALLATALTTTPSFAAGEQTPINIDKAYTVRDTAPPTITFYNYGRQTVTLTNTFGTTTKDDASADREIAQEWATLKATPSLSPYIYVGGKRFNLLQFHFHTPAEHAVGGSRTRMEVHFVHVADSGCGDGTGESARPLVVLGGFIDVGTGSPELAKLFPTGLPTNKLAAAVTVNNVNLAALLPQGQPKWRYEGGLTAPSTACPWFGTATPQLITGEFPEAVHWFLYDQKMYLADEYVKRFEKLFPEGNARSLKEIGTRKVYERTAR